MLNWFLRFLYIESYENCSYTVKQSDAKEQATTSAKLLPQFSSRLGNVGLSLLFIKYHTTKIYRTVEVQLYAFLTSAVDVEEWSAYYSGRYNHLKASAVDGEEWSAYYSGRHNHLKASAVDGEEWSAYYSGRYNHLKAPAAE
jgi:hypothetical protein